MSSEKQEPLLGEEVLPRLSPSGTAPLSRSPSVCAIVGQDELGVGERRERDEEDALREVLDKLRGGLKPEPGLARASRPGQRQQTHVLAPQPLDDRGHLALAADQRRGLDGQVRRPVLERAQGRELVRQPLDHQLREPLRPLQVLEPVLAKVAQLDAVGQLVLDELAASTGRSAPARRGPAAQIRAARGTSRPT